MSEKNRDAKNRWRTVTVAFRLSPEENEELTNRVKMCGCRTRQEYIIQRVIPNGSSGRRQRKKILP